MMVEGELTRQFGGKKSAIEIDSSIWREEIGNRNRSPLLLLFALAMDRIGRIRTTMPMTSISNAATSNNYEEPTTETSHSSSSADEVISARHHPVSTPGGGGGGDDDDDDDLDLHEHSPLSPSMSPHTNTNTNTINVTIDDDHHLIPAIESMAVPANDGIEGGYGDDNAFPTTNSDADTNEAIICDSASSSSLSTSIPLEQPPASSSSSPSTSSTHQNHPSAYLPSPKEQILHQQQQLELIPSQQLVVSPNQPHPHQLTHIIDESKIQKAISFLQNPTIRDVTNNNKRIYLERNTDLTMEEIDAAMDRITTMSKERYGVGGVDGSGKNARDSGRSDQYHPQHRQHDHRQQLLHDPREDDDDFDVVNYHHDYDHHNGAIRRYSPPPLPPHPSVQSTVLPQQSQYDNGYTTTRYRNHGSGTIENDHHHQHQHQPHHRPWEGDEGGSAPGGGGGEGRSSSWVGGFSLGVVGLAAWRWLNGGDFVLFPPPSILSSTTFAESTSTTSATRGNGSVNNHDNGTKSADGAMEEGVTTKSVSWKDLSSCTEEVEEEGGADEDYDDQCVDAEEGELCEEDNDADEEEYDNDEVEEEEEDDDFLDSHNLHAILNRKNSNTTHSHRRYPQPPPPSQHQSYDELVLEIRALTSAIHSHRDSQERIARNAYNTNVGKGMTDDAMDFLRKKKEENNNSNNVVDVSRQDNTSVVTTLLKEVSGDLYELKKQTMNLKPMEGGDRECITELGTMEGFVEEGSKEVGKGEEAVSDVEGPSEQIDVVIEKIKKLLAIVDEKPNRNVVGDISMLENGNDNNNEDGDAGGCTETVIGEGHGKVLSASTELGVAQMSASVVPTESIASRDLGVAQMSASMVPTESIASREVADATTTDDSDLLELEEQYINNSVSLPTSETSPTNLPQQQPQQHQLEDAIRKLANNNDAQQLKVGAQMLYLYCRNISQNASVPRYRKIYTNNNNFRNKLGNLVGAKDFLVAVGFVEHTKENFYEWSDHVGGECTEAEVKSKLDFALVALELMKNGGGGGDFDGGGNPPS